VSEPHHRILAIRYGHHKRKAAANFIGGDDHATDMPLDYYVWAIVRDGLAPIVVDTGFDAEAAARRGRTLLRPVGEGLAEAGIDIAEVEDVIVTHMHFDHAGSLGLFPKARFHVQDAEMAFCTGRAMGERVVRAPFDAANVAEMIHLLFGDRVVFHAGTSEVAPGVTVHHLGGHTAGLQAVEVATARGPVILCSDAAHLYANITRAVPFPIVIDIPAYLASHKRVLALAGGNLDHVIPGHDPLVLALFPPVAGATDIVRCDLPPARSIQECL
jgi:glyoxylase-like metal-dependent hydrolase (beta-lactamase superfamily II)